MLNAMPANLADAKPMIGEKGETEVKIIERLKKDPEQIACAFIVDPDGKVDHDGQPVQHFSPLKFYFNNREQCPVHYIMACKIWSDMGSTAGPERVGSKFTYLLQPRRQGMGPTTASNFVQANYNHKLWWPQIEPDIKAYYDTKYRPGCITDTPVTKGRFPKTPSPSTKTPPPSTKTPPSSQDSCGNFELKHVLQRDSLHTGGAIDNDCQLTASSKRDPLMPPTCRSRSSSPADAPKRPLDKSAVREAVLTILRNTATEECTRRDLRLSLDTMVTGMVLPTGSEFDGVHPPTHMHACTHQGGACMQYALEHMRAHVHRNLGRHGQGKRGPARQSRLGSSSCPLSYPIVSCVQHLPELVQASPVDCN